MCRVRTEGRRTEMEGTHQVSLLHAVPCLWVDLAAADFGHPNLDDRHEANLWVIRLDVYDGSSRHDTQVLLADSLSRSRVLLVLSKVLPQRFRVVGSVNVFDFLDSAADRAVPSMVGERAQESLIYRTTDKVLRQLVVIEHVDEGVRLAFDPKLVLSLHTMRNLVCLALAAIDDYVIIFRACDRSDAIIEAEQASEEVIP